MKQEVIYRQMPPTGLAQTRIETPRMVLRPMQHSDSGLIAHYHADKRVAEMTPSIPHPLPPGATESFMGKFLRDDLEHTAWVMDASPFGGAEVLGIISLEQMDRGQSEISYWVAPAMWNTGFASEAVHALVDANPLQNKTIFGSVFQDNPSSARVLTNAGFDYLGDAEAFSVARGAKVATWTYLKRLG